MPFVVVNAEGLYLRRYPNRGTWQEKREWVPELENATIWPKSGPARLAANHTVKKHGSQFIQIQEVKLMLWGSPVEYAAKRPR